MPAKLDRCVKQVQKQGKNKSTAYAICSRSTGYKAGKGSTKKKKKWIKGKESFKQYFEKTFYNDTLHPKFWTDDKFDEDTLKSLLKIVEDFIETDDHVKPEMIEDIQLTGSMSNFNYNDYSDLDVHLLLDFADINEDETIVKRALDGKRFLWNLRHNIQFNGHDVELYFQDVHDPHVASGLFSLQNNKWIKKPVHDPPEIDHRDVQKKAEQFRTEIELITDALEEVDDKEELTLINSRAKKLKDKLMKMRKEGLASKGEFSIENLAFKELRNDETIAELNSLIIKSYDLMFTKDEVTEKKKKKKKGLDKFILSLVHALHSHNPSAPHMPFSQYPQGV
tara:strand:- start:762 stop:1772 length:1011 start_codon:yes stop_codon:yes gene_type:complete